MIRSSLTIVGLVAAAGVGSAHGRPPEPPTPLPIPVYNIGLATGHVYAVGYSHVAAHNASFEPTLGVRIRDRFLVLFGDMMHRVRLDSNLTGVQTALEVVNRRIRDVGTDAYSARGVRDIAAVRGVLGRERRELERRRNEIISSYEELPEYAKSRRSSKERLLQEILAARKLVLDNHKGGEIAYLPLPQEEGEASTTPYVPASEPVSIAEALNRAYRMILQTNVHTGEDRWMQVLFELHLTYLLPIETALNGR